MDSSLRHKDYVTYLKVAAALRHGPCTIERAANRTSGYLRALGLFKISERFGERRLESTRAIMHNLVIAGWVQQNGELYSLSCAGLPEVEKRMRQLTRTGALIRQLPDPEIASKITFAAHLALAVIKLPMGFVTGSIGLINDGCDTLMDAISSALVYLGLRFKRERLVTIVLVLFMSVTGIFAFSQAMMRFLAGRKPEANLGAFVASLLSIAVCLVLLAYQRYSGLRSGSMSIIALSVDSRNHVIVEFGVIVGLFAALMDFTLLDTLVGLYVAFVILKGAAELAIDLFHSRGKEKPDLSRYTFGLATDIGNSNMSNSGIGYCI